MFSQSQRLSIEINAYNFYYHCTQSLMSLHWNLFVQEMMKELFFYISSESIIFLKQKAAFQSLHLQQKLCPCIGKAIVQ